MELIINTKKDINLLNANITLPTNISNSVTHLTFGEDYDQPTIIPNSVIEHNLKEELIIK